MLNASLYWNYAKQERFYYDGSVHCCIWDKSDIVVQQMNFPSDPTKADLDKILLAVCDEQFSKNFGFEYRGKDSEPRDMGPEPNPPIYACKAQFSVEKVGDSSAAKFVEQIMRCVYLSLAFMTYRYVFRNWPDILNGRLPQVPFILYWRPSTDRSLSESIRSDLITQVQRCFDGTMSPNEFHDSKIDVDARYNYGTQDRLPLGTKSLFLYCDGSTTSPVGEHAFTATLHVIYYIGVRIEIASKCGCWPITYRCTIQWT